MPRAKNPELLAVVERQMVMGLTVPECLSEIEDDGELRCTERTLKRYRADIRQRWDTEEVELRPQRRAEFRAMVRFGFRDSIASRQHIAAAQFAKILAKLDGLEAPARLDINIGISVRAMTPMQREAEIMELLAKRREALDGTRAGKVTVLLPGANGKGNGHG